MLNPDRWSDLVEPIMHYACEGGNYPRRTEVSIDLDKVSKYVDEVIKNTFFDELFEKREVHRPNDNNNDRYASGRNMKI
jgi:hypothetical protein